MFDIANVGDEYLPGIKVMEWIHELDTLHFTLSKSKDERLVHICEHLEKVVDDMVAQLGFDPR